MSDTPRTDNIFGEVAYRERRVGHGAEKLCRELERENAELREAVANAFVCNLNVQAWSGYAAAIAAFDAQKAQLEAVMKKYPCNTVIISAGG